MTFTIRLYVVTLIHEGAFKVHVRPALSPEDAVNQSLRVEAPGARLVTVLPENTRADVYTI